MPALLDQVSSAQYFSKLDFVSGYWQVPMRPQDIPKQVSPHSYDSLLWASVDCIGFRHTLWYLEFRVMPFGLCGAPSILEHMMDAVFARPAELSNGHTISYGVYCYIS